MPYTELKRHLDRKFGAVDEQLEHLREALDDHGARFTKIENVLASVFGVLTVAVDDVRPTSRVAVGLHAVQNELRALKSEISELKALVNERLPT